MTFGCSVQAQRRTNAQFADVLRFNDSCATVLAIEPAICSRGVTMPKKRATTELTESPEGSAIVTPLLRFIRALKAAERETGTDYFSLFLKALTPTHGKPTTKVYLYQLAGNVLPNPTLRLAKAIVEQTRVLGPRINERPLTYEDLLVGKLAVAPQK